MELSECRPEVQAFAVRMEEVLRAHGHKGGWKDCPAGYLFTCLLEEVVELSDAMFNSGPLAINQERIANECANFAMMIHDNFGMGG